LADKSAEATPLADTNQFFTGRSDAHWQASIIALSPMGGDALRPSSNGGWAPMRDGVTE
jgi:hypothetical protein